MDINKTLEELRDVSQWPAVSAESVSAWPVGMHVHHCCLAMNGICQALKDSVPPPPRRKFSLLRSIVFLTGVIPRGRGKAPRTSLPAEANSSEFLSKQLEESERLISDIEKIDSQKWFTHHVFGILDRDQALKFIGIHNNHHLKIIRDILAA